MAERFDVMHVIRPAAGGMKNHLRALVRGTVARGHRVLVAGPADLVADMDGDGPAVCPVWIEPGYRPERWLVAVGRLARLARRHRVAVLHAHGGAGALVAGPAGRLAGVPAVIVTVHGSLCLGSGLRRRAAALAQRGVLRLTDRVITVADGLRAELLAQGLVRPDQVVTVHNGTAPPDGLSREAARAEIRRELGLGPDRSLVGTVARLAPQKGLEYLVRALARLKAREPRPVLVVVGDGPRRGELASEAGTLGVTAVFLGHRADVAWLLGAFDLFVLPSVTEGLPLVVLEAMAAGCPVVAARVGGVSEAVRDGATGWLVPPADPDALARAIDEALANPIRAQAYAAAARVRVRRRFTVDRMVEKTLAVYREALCARGFPELGIVF